jgi:hypothetical protein
MDRSQACRRCRNAPVEPGTRATRSRTTRARAAMGGRGPGLRMPRPGRARAGSTGQPCSPLYEPHSRRAREKERSSNSRGPTARSKRPQPMVPAPLSAGPRNAGMADSQVRPPLRCSKKVGLAMAPGEVCSGPMNYAPLCRRNVLFACSSRIRDPASHTPSPDRPTATSTIPHRSPASSAAASG